MIDEKQIQEAIAYCQGKVDPKREDAILLAACYIIQDHFSPRELFGNSEQFPGYSYAPPPAETPQITAAPETVGEYGDSDFLRAVAGEDPAAAWEIMNELMEDLRIINPRVYDGVMRRIRVLRG